MDSGAHGRRLVFHPASLPDSAVVLESIGISRSEVEGAQETVNGWLDELGFTGTA